MIVDVVRDLELQNREYNGSVLGIWNGYFFGHEMFLNFFSLPKFNNTFLQ